MNKKVQSKNAIFLIYHLELHSKMKLGRSCAAAAIVVQMKWHEILSFLLHFSFIKKGPLLKKAAAKEFSSIHEQKQLEKEIVCCRCSQNVAALLLFAARAPTLSRASFDNDLYTYLRVLKCHFKEILYDSNYNVKIQEFSCHPDLTYSQFQHMQQGSRFRFLFNTEVKFI